MRNKKGSMELGINAIVVLIIALALLGLGIGFVTKLFTASQSKMVRIIDRTELPIHADSLNPMVFDTTNLEVKAGKSEPLIVSIYNDANVDVAGPPYGQGAFITADSCVDSLGIPISTTSDIMINSPAQGIGANIDAGFAVIVQVDSNLRKGSYICTVGSHFFDANGMGHDLTKQLFVDVI